MLTLSKHAVNKLTASELRDKMPFKVVSDGEVVGYFIASYDVNGLTASVNKLAVAKAKPNHDVNKLKEPGELMFSKNKQAKGRMRHLT